MEEESRNPAGEHEEQLRKLVKLHGIRYEVGPETQVVDGQFVRIGFNLWLYGTHEHAGGTTAGCVDCIALYGVLRDVATWALPKGRTAARFEIEPFDRSLRAAANRADSFEVRLEVKISHRDDFFAPIDIGEETCLQDMRQNLEQLGVRGS